jgi:ribosomal protein S14
VAIELPDRVYKKDRKFYKGMFIAANVRVVDGIPLFGQVNSDKVLEMQHKRQCQLCGRKISLQDWCVFPGGALDYKYQEAPLHIDCARYSLQVCPHILSKQDKFVMSVCRRYDVVDFEPPMWRDPGAVPHWSRLSPWQSFSLTMAHETKEQKKDSEGLTVCDNCGSPNAGRMTYDEFMKWSER